MCLNYGGKMKVDEIFSYIFNLTLKKRKTLGFNDT